MVLVGGLGAAAAPPASAATPSCASACTNIYSSQYGERAILYTPNNIFPQIGQPVLLAPGSNTNEDEDFDLENEGTVSEFIAGGLMNPGMSSYDSQEVYELEYDPYGAGSGYCVGTSGTPGNATPVTLQPCGLNCKTCWIQAGTAPNFDLISGATNSDFVDPQVLTAPPAGLPLVTFTAESTGNGIYSNQVWEQTTGVYVPSKQAGPSARVAAPIATAAGGAIARRDAAPVVPASAYVANLLEGDVTPVDLPAGPAATPASVGGAPDAVAITPDGTSAYVADGFPGGVSPVTVATGTVGSTISGDAGWASAVAITPNGQTAYVTDADTNQVTPITVATNTAGTSIPVGNAPDGIAITPDGATAYVANSEDGTVTPINLAAGTAGSPITVGHEPSGVAITPDGTTAYVTNLADNTVTPITVATNTAGTPIAVGDSPDAIAITPDATTAYVANAGDATVTPIDLATGTAGTPIPVGLYPDGVAITPDGTTAVVSDFYGSAATSINIATDTVNTGISVDNGPYGVAVTGPMQIGNDPTLPGGTTGTAYLQPIWAVAGTTPFTYALTGGSLPPGLTLSHTGVISGTPTAGRTLVHDHRHRQQHPSADRGEAFALTVTQPPTVITQPVNQSVTVGSGATFTAAFTGNPAPTMQWQVSTDGGHTFTDISGATSGTLSVSSATASQSGNEYPAVGSNSVDKNVPSNAAKLTVITIPAIVTAPTISTRSRSVKVGQKLTCSDGSWTESPTSYTYQWSRDGTPIAGARSPTYTVQQLDEGNTLTCTVTARTRRGRVAGNQPPVQDPGSVRAALPGSDRVVVGHEARPIDARDDARTGAACVHPQQLPRKGL